MIVKIILVFIFFNSIVLNNCFVRSEENLIKTSSGYVKGSTINVFNQNIEQYLGIPFAEPPVGSLRFAKPKPISKPKEGIIDATKAKYSCIQSISQKLEEFLGNLTLSEDCLTLNIWTPKVLNSTKLKAVMFWIYGGGLQLGSIYQPSYNGKVLVTNDVIFVSTNYRLGHFGFLYAGQESAPGNVGLYDQLLALKWVRENIHLFGGDKNQITIFGQSAGSWSVSTHLLSPLSKGMFKRAIMESGAQFHRKERPLYTKEDALLNAKELAKTLNCSDDNQWLECLRRVDAKLLLTNQGIIFPIEGTEFIPFSAQKAFQEMKFNKDIDIIAGVTKDEGANLEQSGFIPEHKNLTRNDFKSLAKYLFSIISPVFNDINVEKVTDFYLKNTKLNDSDAIKWRLFDVYSDLLLKCPTYKFAKRYAERSSYNTNVFFYEITHMDPNGMLTKNAPGVIHGAELDFVFGLNLLSENTSEENKNFSKEVMKYWTDFAKYGKPDDNWPTLINIKTNSSVTQTKDLTPKNVHKYFNGLFDDTCDGFWKEFF